MKNAVQIFHNLSEKIERDWQKINYATEDFYKVALEHAQNVDFSEMAEVSTQLELLDDPSIRQTQVASTFSDLYFQPFSNGRFSIEILNWWGGHVNIHDHDFSAVQMQLKGDSLNVVYDFETEENHGSLKFGQLGVRKAEIWEEGEISLVRAGNLDPHSVLHLGKPTTSLLIRTLPTRRLGAQTNYFPTLAAHYDVNTTVQRKKLTALSLIAKSDSEEFKRQLLRLYDLQSLSENFFMILKLGETCFRKEHIGAIQEICSKGASHERLITNVIFNNATDFFKRLANNTSQATDVERLSAFVMAASFDPFSRSRILDGIKESGLSIDLNQNFESLFEKLDFPQQRRAEKYLSILDFKRGKNEDVSNTIHAI